MERAVDESLHQLACAAGLEPEWRDAHGAERSVSDDSLRSLLRALGVACDTPAQISDSLQHLHTAETFTCAPVGISAAPDSSVDVAPVASASAAAAVANRLWIALLGEPIDVPGSGEAAYRVVLESGVVLHGCASPGSQPGMVRIAALEEPGYHRLEMGAAVVHLAICPPHCPGIPFSEAERPRAWGVTAQLYSLHGSARMSNIAGGHAYPCSPVDASSSADASPSALACPSVDAHFPVGDGSEADAAQDASDPWLRGGSYDDLAVLAAAAGRAGASALATSPVHAMFSADPSRYSPYSPSSRLFLNAAYAQPHALFGADMVRQAIADTLACEDEEAATCFSSRPASLVATSSGAQQGGPNTQMTQEIQEGPTGQCSATLLAHLLDACGPVLDWPRVTARRLAVLRRLQQMFVQRPEPALEQDLLQFRQAGGEPLESHARYEALHAFYAKMLGAGHGWRAWPEALHDPQGSAVARFAQDHRQEVDFHIFLQWLASRGLAHAQQQARTAGMTVGLIADLAIGTDPRGSHAWSRQAHILNGVSVGAPPDIFQPLGQNWGLTAFSPLALRNSGYAALIETLRAAFAHAGGIRIDHILGLHRMWLISEGSDAGEGAYLRYPQQDMLRLVALEAWRHGAIVVGENLGTVPEGLNEALAQQSILGSSVLWFERDPAAAEQPGAAAFTPPHHWPSWTMATTTTHDLPTVEGWWAGRDIDWRAALGQLTGEQTERAHQERTADKAALFGAIGNAGLLHQTFDERRGGDADDDKNKGRGPAFSVKGMLPEPPCESPDALPVVAPREAVLAFVAGTPSPLAMFPMEDLIGLVEQPNLPLAGPPLAAGALAHPSWLQQLPMAVGQIFTDPGVKRCVEQVQRARMTRAPDCPASHNQAPESAATPEGAWPRR